MTSWTPFAASACLVLLSACATTETPENETRSANCGAPEARTGTLVVRRETCVETTEAERAAARRQLETMQREQDRVRRGAGPAGS